MTATCTTCESPDVFSTRPGTDAQRVDLLDLVVARPVPDRHWCRPCWVAQFGGGA